MNKLNAELNKKPNFIKMVSDNPLRDAFTTNVVEYDANDSAYHFEHGFCIMHAVKTQRIMHFDISYKVEYYAGSRE